MITKVKYVKADESNIESVINNEINNPLGVSNIIPYKDGVLILYTDSQINRQTMGYQPKQITDSNSNLATARQLRYIKSLMEKTGEQIDLTNLSKQQAGSLIRKLKKLANSKDNSKEETDNFKPSFKMDDIEGMFDGD